MSTSMVTAGKQWSLPQKIAFRFFFIYFILYTSPWEAFEIIPGISHLIGWYNQALEWAVITTNEHIFKVFGKVHVQPVYNGSGDTSYNWAAFCFMLLMAAVGAVIWSIAHRKADSYRQLNYLLCLFIRYSLALIAFSYGIQKIFALQMPFPLTSQLATPLGDFLPMRFSWLFIGYSTPYEIFSGILEVVVALLLLYRRTATLGVLLATTVFMNVMMLNLCYDIPVKLYSMNIVLACLYLLVNEWQRLYCFFVLNKPAAQCSVYNYTLTRKWMRITRIVLKVWVVFLFCYSTYDAFDYYKESNSIAAHKTFSPGIYNVTKFVRDNDSIPTLVSDSIAWKDFIIDNGYSGSIATSDTMFRRRYGRGYFVFETDSLKPVVHFKKMNQAFLTFNYRVADSATIQLWGRQKNDSLFIELKRSSRNFQLAEKQFHWLSEANR